MASFDRMVRSIYCPYHGYSSPSLSVVTDVMDVLAMTEPQDMKFAPSTRQLEPAAKRLLTKGAPRRCRWRTATKDLSMFLSILLRMKLDKAKWGLGFHFGGFDEANPEDKNLASIMIEGTGLPVDFHPSIMDLLPNLPLRFHQLWAVLFQSAKTTNEQVPKITEAASEEIPT
ncbi:hypothetical protein SI65_09704 [Aspergillus cristatus]|uniref:Uncharacterized protein n=1 Tax=Aspergillus cristatus TaxID=573508 RepID=A0A1E3B1Y9_ASPCR|nr:hypothetical protein SI65_09704 [Aspergillus cristatus]